MGPMIVPEVDFSAYARDKKNTINRMESYKSIDQSSK